MRDLGASNCTEGYDPDDGTIFVVEMNHIERHGARRSLLFVASQFREQVG